jgi:chemotaxis protein methyltransferase CheR
VSELALSLLKDFVVKRLGARPNNPVVEDLPARFREISRRAEIDPLELVHAIRASGEELSAALGDLTIGETWFFRDAKLFRLLEETILRGQEDRAGTLRIWSAGCATGEEAWTLAYTARRGVRTRPVEVLGTDLDPARLERARSRRYPKRQARGVALPPLFADAQGEELVVRDVAGVHVRFEPHNLVVDRAPLAGSFELIVCRNVLLYLHEEAVRRALETFATALAPRGWLVLGPSDVIDRPSIVPEVFAPLAGWPTVFRLEGLRPAPAPAAEEESFSALPIDPSAPTPALPIPLASQSAAARVRYLVRLAEARLAGGNEPGAEAACLEALDLEPGSASAVLLLVRIAVGRGETTLARLVLEEVVRAHPHDAELARALAELRRTCHGAR